MAKDDTYNPSQYGLTLQQMICDNYDLEVNAYAAGQFEANYNEAYEAEFEPIVASIEKMTGSKPVKLLTFTTEVTGPKQTTCPHNFLLANGKTLSVRTSKSSGMVASRTVGQAGFDVLNDYFAEIFGGRVEDQRQLREKMYANIHKALPIFIECFFPSDYNIIVERQAQPEQAPKLSLYKLSDIADYTFERKDFTFTRDLDKWVESTTLKYKGVSIAELQTHKNRSFKFRFKLSAIPEWFKLVKETTETFGMTAEAAICDHFGLEKPDSFKTRVSNALRKELMPVVAEAFKIMPKAVRHTGSEGGERGDASKCSYDFELEGGKTLSVKTNTGNRVCPPEVGQPGSATCLLYFKDYLPEGIEEVSNTDFKEMVLGRIEELMPVYLSHLFDSDWLLWIYKAGKEYKFEAIHQDEIRSDFKWERDKFSFTKPTVEEWAESNTVKYDGETIGEFQVHNHRVCFKFRFHMPNTLKLLRKK